MAKSIRITDELYEMALQEAGLMGRSLAQQVEHWVKLGIGLEKSPHTTVDDVRAASLRYRHVRDGADVRAGRRTAESLHAIPAEIARTAKAVFPPASAFSRRKAK